MDEFIIGKNDTEFYINLIIKERSKKFKIISRGKIIAKSLLIVKKCMRLLPDLKVNSILISTEKITKGYEVSNIVIKLSNNRIQDKTTDDDNDIRQSTK